MLAERTSSKLSTGGGPATVQSDVFGPFLRTARLGYARTGTIRPRGERRLREPPPARDFSGSVAAADLDRKSTRLNSSHLVISYAVFCLKKKKTQTEPPACA